MLCERIWSTMGTVGDRQHTFPFVGAGSCWHTRMICWVGSTGVLNGWLAPVEELILAQSPCQGAGKVWVWDGLTVYVSMWGKFRLSLKNSCIYLIRKSCLVGTAAEGKAVWPVLFPLWFCSLNPGDFHQEFTQWPVQVWLQLRTRHGAIIMSVIEPFQFQS